MEIAEKLTRVSVPALDDILGIKYPVLDKGFIRVIDYMGSDSRIVQAARVSYGAGTKKISEDEGLIRFLLRHSHTTPFEMPKITLHIRMPMDAWRQHIRHRMSNTNEYSTRYSEAIDDKQQTTEWRTQATTNKQGSAGLVTEWPVYKETNSDPVINAAMRVSHAEYIESAKAVSKTPSEYLSLREEDFHEDAAALYQERLAFGVAREQARKDLPLSTYTEAYWTCDLHNLLHYLSLRMDKHAQLEIRSYANQIGEIVKLWCPLTWAAFNDYNFRRNALLLSARDLAVFQCVSAEDGCKVAASFGWLEKNDKGDLKTNRERAEYEAKLTLLSPGSYPPWYPDEV